ncbi:MAG: AI-2E family transporter [Acidobacteriaceae bacterium]
MSHLTPTAYLPPRHHSVRGEILFAFGVAIAIYLAWLLRDILVLIYVSALCAVVLLPVVRGVQRIRIGRWQPSHGIAITIIMFILVGAMAGFLVLTVPSVVQEIKTFAENFPSQRPAFLDKFERLPILRDMNFAGIESRIKADTAQHVGTFVSSLSEWAAKFFQILTGIFLTIYFLAEGDRVYHWFLSLVPLPRRERLDGTLQRAAIRMGRWLLGQGALMLILGVLSGIVFGSMHIKYAFALAVLMGSFNIVPVVGALVSTSLAMLVAASESWAKVLGVLIFELVYLQIENAYLTPLIIGSSVDLAGTAVFIALLLGGGLAGIAGVAVAVPSAVLIAVLIEEYVIRPADAAGEPDVVPVGSAELR